MQLFRKLEFLPEQWEAMKPLIQKQSTFNDKTTFSWDSEIVALVHEVGHICIEQGLDDEGRPKCLQLSPKVAVDIVWKSEVLDAFKPFLVFPKPIGIHSMGKTLDAEYTKEYCRLNPNSEYCKTTTTIK